MLLTKKLAWIAPFAATALFIFCLLNSGSVAESSRRYLILCGERVVPSLFVFSVLGALVAQSGALNRLCKLMPLWGTEAAVLALGLCGGVPLGPLTALELYRGGSIGKRQAEYLCTFSCTPSLSFIISFVGSILDRQIGMELALLTVLFAVFTAIIAKPLMLKPNERSIKPTLRSSSKPFSVVLASSAVSAVIVCGCVVFFGSMAEMLPKGIGGLLEISAGIARCRSATEAAVLLGFSGVSILCQCSAACNGELDMLPCMTVKVIQAIFMGGIAFFIID